MAGSNIQKLARLMWWTVSWLLWLLSPFIPLFAAIGKGIGNSFGMLGLFMGVTTLSVSIITGPLWPLTLAVILAIILISLNMEGRATYQWLNDCSNYFSPSKQKDSGSSSSQLSLFKGAWFWPLAWLIGMAGALLAALGKGANMAFGTFNTLDLSAQDPIGLFVIILAAVVIGAVSLGKEGWKFFKHVTGKSGQPKQESKNVSAFKKGMVCGFAITIPFLAAIIKGFGYGYGALKFLTFVGMTGAALQPVAWLVFGLVFLSIVLISLGMEGKSLNLHIKEWFLGRGGSKGQNKSSGSQACQKSFEFADKRRGEFVVSLLVPLLAAFGKGASMGMGAFGILVFVLGMPSSAPLLIAICFTLGISVACVSLGKEGMKFFKEVNYFKTDLGLVTEGSGNSPVPSAKGSNSYDPSETKYGYNWLIDPVCEATEATIGVAKSLCCCASSGA